MENKGEELQKEMEDDEGHGMEKEEVMKDDEEGEELQEEEEMEVVEKEKEMEKDEKKEEGGRSAGRWL